MWIDLTILMNSNKYLLLLLLCKIFWSLTSVSYSLLLIFLFCTLSYSSMIWISERDLSLEKGPGLTCARPDTVKVRYQLWFCAVLQAVEHPTCSIVTHFKSELYKKVLLWRCCITKGIIFKSFLMYMKLAGLSPLMVIGINRLCIETG